MNKGQLQILADSLNVKPEVFNVWYPYFIKYLVPNGINTPKRLLAFLAQTAQESGNFYYTEEIDKTTCQRYEGGCTYLGRGLIGLTHRGNYDKFGKRYGVDAVQHPEKIGGENALVSTPEQLKNSLLSATFYWENGNLNALADKLDLSKSVNDPVNNSVFKCIGRKINRGYGTDCKTAANGEATRIANFEKLRVAYNQNKPKFTSVTSSPTMPVMIGVTAAIGIGFIGLFLYDKYRS